MIGPGFCTIPSIKEDEGITSDQEKEADLETGFVANQSVQWWDRCSTGDGGNENTGSLWF
jgi:hypothetical protein